MRLDILVGEPEVDLLAIKDKALENLASGKAVTMHGVQTGNGTGQNKGWQVINGVAPDAVLECARYALYRFDPVKYSAFKPKPRRKNFYFGRISL